VRLGFTRIFGAAKSLISIPGAELVRLDSLSDLVRAIAA
jgi:hypothetical protein